MSSIINWRETKFKFVSRIISGGTPQSGNPDYWDGPITWLTPVDLGNKGSDAIYESARRLTTAGVKAAGLEILPSGTVVISTRAPIGSVGLLACEATTNQGCKAVIPEERLINSKFIYYLALDSAEKLRSLGLGTTFVELSTYALKNFRLCLPNVIEQRHIASYLDKQTAKIDLLIRLRQRQIELLREQRAALIQQAVTRGLNPNAPMRDSSIPWLGEIPAHWRKTKLARIARQGRGTFINGPFGSDLLTSELKYIGVPVVYIRDIKQSGYQRVSKAFVTQQKANSLSVFRVDPGDVIVAKVGDPPGTAAIYPNDEPAGVVTQDVIRIKPNLQVIAPTFLVLWLNSYAGKASLDQIAVESTRMRVDLASYKGLLLWLPPLSEQLSIISAIQTEISRIDNLVEAYSRQITLLQEYRASLIHECVTGQRTIPASCAP
ncbi:MAG: restriction endonuclease subunit S [Candidatus Competibacteraceae bacterium]